MQLPVLRPDLALYGKHAVHTNHYVAGQIEVTSKCFQQCFGCDSWREDLKGTSHGEWTLEQLITVATDLLSTGEFEHLSLTGGDPQAWPWLTNFIGWWASNAGMKTLPNPKLQLNTALTQDLTNEQREWWRRGVADLRISLDAIDHGVYEKIRGRGLHREGNCTSPDQVLRRCMELDHPGLTTNTTVFFENIGECKRILDTLHELWSVNKMAIRKAHFLPAIGGRGHDLQTKYFWESWEQFREYAKACPLPTSVGENPHEVRQFLASPEAQGIGCWTGRLSFHIKCDGYVYPCCLVGGEALKTQFQFRMGSVFEESIHEIQKRYLADFHYADGNKPCRDICQWKQLQINVAGQTAAALRLAMP